MKLEELNQKIESIPGYFNMLEMYIWDWILQYQNSDNIVGNMVEFGVFKGKSFAKMAQYHKYGERLLGVDIGLAYEGRRSEILNSIKKASTISLSYVNLIEARTQYLNFNEKIDNMFYRENVRFMHLDGGHDGYTVYRDLATADQMLAKNGILVMDDWRTLFYPDIAEAFYRYTSTHPESFVPVLTTDTKMYAARPAMHQDYLWKFETQLWPFMKENYKEQPLSCLRTKNFVRNCQLLMFPSDKIADCEDNSMDSFDIIK